MEELNRGFCDWKNRGDEIEEKTSKKSVNSDISCEEDYELFLTILGVIRKKDEVTSIITARSRSQPIDLALLLSSSGWIVI